MTVLVIGFRLGAIRALDQKGVAYIIWSEKPLKNPRDCVQVIIEKYPSKKSSIDKYKSLFENVTHVIAVSEAAVIPASRIRRWLNLYRNKESVITHCTDKLEMKKYLSKMQIPMTKFKSSKGKTAQDIVDSLGLPVVNKVKLSSGGRGVKFLNTLREVDAYLDKDSYFEKPIKGTEGSIESFVQDGEILFTNITRYHKHGACNILPGDYSEDIINKIQNLNHDVIKALKLKWGMTHLEYYILEDGQILFGEVALRPPGGYIMDALKLAYNQNFWSAFISIELNEKNIHFNERCMYAASIIIHPGEGLVSNIFGKEEVESLVSTKKFKLKLGAGDVISHREGLGQDFGYVLMANPHKDELKHDVDSFFAYFNVELQKIKDLERICS